MIAELVAQMGKSVLGDIPPDGRAYWAARSWDRDAASQHPLLGADFRQQEEVIGDYLGTFARDSERGIEVGCGTGRFTRLTADRTGCTDIVALDISARSLELSRRRVPEEHVRFRLGDFWSVDDLGTADLVVCVDAIHHLGDVAAVLARLRGLVKPGGLLIGNVWIADHFHEFQRRRYGSVEHVGRTLAFAWAAVLIRLSGRRLKAGSYRTQLVRAAEVEELLRATFPAVLDVTVNRYFVSFACRV
jgi:SAM-dependent methyltransferase